LGTTPGCVILSIGAVFFDIDSGKLGKNFYSIISQDSCRLVGLKVEQETLKWWNSQSVEAKKLLE